MFSSIESLALITLVITIYRFKLKDCFWPAMLVTLVMSIQSLLLREEALANLVPFVNVFLITLLLVTILEVPIQWAFFVSLGGYVASVLLQGLIVEVSFGIFSLKEIKHDPPRGYIFQSVYAACAYLLSKFLYSRGIGFSFNFNKKRFKWERAIVVSTIIVSFCLFGITLYAQEVLLDLAVLSVALTFFLYISVRKEVNR